MPRAPAIVLLALLAGCGQRPPPTPAVVAVEPPKVEVAKPAPPVKPTPPELVALPTDAGGAAVAGFLAPRDLHDLTAKPVATPVPAPVARFEAPLPAANVPLPESKPSAPPPLLRGRVGPRSPPEPGPPSALAPVAADYALSPRAVEPWRLPPAADPLAPPEVPPAPRRQPERGRLADPAAALTTKRVADAPIDVGRVEFRPNPPASPRPRLAPGPAKEVATEPVGR